MFLECAIAGCTTEQKLVATFGADTSLQFGNSFKHMQAVHGFLLLPDDVKDRGTASAKKRKSAGGGGGGGGGGDGEDEGDGSAVRIKINVSEEMSDLAKLLLGMGWTPVTVERPIFRAYWQKRGVPRTSRRTIVRVLTNLKREIFENPRDEFLKKALSSVVMHVDGVAYQFDTKIAFGLDGVSTQGGHKNESFVAATGFVTQHLGQRRLLQPATQVVALRWWKPEPDVGGVARYSAAEHARETRTTLNSLHVNPRHVLCWNVDTTNGQQSMCEMPEFYEGGLRYLERERAAALAAGQELRATTGTIYMECSQHVSSLVGVDSNKIGDFDTAVTSAVDMSTWMRASDSRGEQFAKAQTTLLTKDPPGLSGKKPLRLIANCDTRFLIRLLVCDRVVNRAPAFDELFTSNNFDVATKAAYKQLYTRLKMNLATIAAIVKLFRPLVLVSPGFGCQRRYTASLRPAIFLHLLTKAEELEQTAEGIGIIGIIEGFKGSIYRRFASLKVIEAARASNELPESSGLKSDDDWTKFGASPFYPRVKLRDQIDAAAAFLDPALNHKLVDLGVSSHRRIFNKPVYNFHKPHLHPGFRGAPRRAWQRPSPRPARPWARGGRRTRRPSGGSRPPRPSSCARRCPR